MLNFADTASSVREPKSERMNHRMAPSVKDKIQQAAALLGVDESAFVTSVALERAQAAIDAHERTVMRGADREAFFAALEQPPKATQALRDAFALHSRMVAPRER